MSFQTVESQPDFVKLEKRIFSWWQQHRILEKYLHKNENSSKRFSFLDGPITANNPMGVHHAWGRTLKDLYQRYHNMLGEKQRFQNGFDCQGLWVEVEVEKELGFKTKKEIESYGIDKFVEKCKERVRKFAKIQEEQSKRLGYFMDWQNSYFTLSDENNYMIWYFLKKCWLNGWLYKGRDSVPWCPRCGTAISQHEILTEDYQEVEHESVYFKLKVRDPKIKANFLVWTTTPWTIPGNVALVVDPKLIYLEVEENGERFILAQERKQILKGSFKILKKYTGKDLVGLIYEAPFDDLPRVKKSLLNYRHRVVACDPLILPINLKEGTGVVHCAPGAGTEDFALAKKENLPVIELIDEEGNYLNDLGNLSQLNAKKNPQLIFNYLKEKGTYLYKLEKIRHRYPVCWRCKTELVWRVVDEWYIAMDKPVLEGKSLTLRQRMIRVAKKINWLPKFGLERELDWLRNMHDWLISKKRYWGLALPIWQCSCGQFKVIGGFEELKKEAVEGWLEFQGHSPHRPWVDKIKIKCQCGRLMSRIPDVGNPWLDAGIVPFSTLNYLTNKNYWRQWYPADFITESFPGQFKNWFYALIAMATVLEDSPPYKTVLGFGTLLAEDGRPMHKSWGNAIEFNEGADKIGVEVMRWLYSLTDPARNLLFGYKLADEARRKFHLILWNSYKFFVTFANLNNWQPKEIKENLINFSLDKWLLTKLKDLINKTTFYLNHYQHFKAAAEIQKFVEDLSVWYIRRSRDRVNPTNDDKKEVDICLSVLYHTFTVLCRLLAPFLPFLTEEIYKNLTQKESVHLSNWPKTTSLKLTVSEKKILQEMALVRQICEKGHALRKKAKIKVRQPLASLLIKGVNFNFTDLLDLIKDELNLKQIKLAKGKILSLKLDTHLTSELKAEGKAREIIRKIQMERKKIGCPLTAKIEITLPDWPELFTEEIKKKTFTKSLIKGKKFCLKVIEG